MSHQQDCTIVVPSPHYANDWVECFKAAYPEMRGQAREVYLALTGHADWLAMERSCHPEALLFEFDALPAEERRQKCFRMRKLLVEIFYMRPTVANNLAWTNPPGIKGIWRLEGPASPVLLADGLPANLDQIYAELDELNLGYCLGTEQGERRLHHRPEIGAHLGICKHLGWDFEVVGLPDQQLVEADSDGHLFAEPVAFVNDPDLGRVPVFVAGFTSTPGQAHDEVLVEYLTAVLSTSEMLNGNGSPGIVFFESSTSRKRGEHYFTNFGALVYHNEWKDLYLSERCKSLSDVFVNLATSRLPDAADFADENLNLQRKFENARQKSLVPEGCDSQLFGLEEPSGWWKMVLQPNT